VLLDGGCVGGRLGGPSSSAPDRPVKVNGQDIQNQNLKSYFPRLYFNVDSNIILPLKNTYFWIYSKAALHISSTKKAIPELYMMYDVFTI